MLTLRTPLKILFSCVGRRVELVEAFKNAAAKLKLQMETFGADQSRNAPAMEFVDRPCVLPPISDGGYVEAMLRLVRRNRISLIVPVLDLDLLTLALAKPRFETVGCTVLISSPQTVATCRDKLLTYHHLRAAGIDTPQTWSL